MLKKLELIGFKSFPEKTIFDFTGGIIAVVGPNGCGKSNISDAIRWVLGEHRAKSLRGEKMEDFIFSGTQAQHPMNVAEVSLTLDNSQSFLNLDYNEVTVTRKFYRSGDSEYLLNKTPCRLKDIQEIFMDTGLGKDTYSIISQGEIDKILSASPYERRYLFEEASGILKHKSRKHEALKKLEDTKENLSRVSDIVEELQQQLPGLEAQAVQAKKYRALIDNLTELEVNLMAHKIEENRDKWYDLDNQHKQLDRQLQNKSNELTKKASELEFSKTDLQKIESEIEDFQQDNISIVSEIEQKQGQIKILDERWENQEQEKQRLAQEKEQLNSQLSSLKKRDEQLREQKSDLSEQKQQKKSRLNEVDNNLEELSKENTELDNNKATLIEVINKRQQLESEYNNQNRDCDRLRQEIMELEANIDKYQTRVDELNQKRTKLETENYDKQQQTHEISEKIQDTQRKLQELKSYKQTNSDRISELQKLLQSYRSRYEALMELYKSDSFSRGVQEIIKLKDHNPEKWQGIKGTVSQLFTTDNIYAKAIETALGQALQNVVTVNDEIAKKVLDYLKQNNKGRATCLPVSNLKPRFLHEKQKQIVDKFEITGIGSELVKVDPQYKIVADHLLARVVVVPNLDNGLALAKQLGFSIKIVTLDGELILPGGAMVGGSHKKSSSKGSKLLQDEDQHALEEKISKTNYELKTKEQAGEKLDNSITEQQQQLEKLSKEKQQLELEVQSIAKDQDRLGEEEEEKKEQLEVYRLKKEDKQAQLDDNLINIERLTCEIKELDERRKKSEAEIDRLESEYAQINEDYQNYSQEKSQLEIEIGKLDERLKNLSREIDEINEQLRQYQEGKLPSNNESLENIERKISQTISEKSQNKNELNDLTGRQKQISDKLEVLKSNREKMRQQIQQQEEDHKLMGQEERALEKQVSQIKMQKSKVETELSNILTRLDEQYYMTYEQAFNYKQPIQNYEEQQKQINELKKQIDELGEVNLGAIEEYDKLTERLQFLHDQQKDLQEAEHSLQKLLKEIDRTMKDSFAKTVSKINKAFGKVYEEIYQGGSAYLAYTDENDLLNTGIEIIAKPPGKKKQTLSLLSGGERALTVIALLFAVHQIKPTPFCILDEIDASLDESNLDILTRYLKAYSSKTQFIVITHRKKTMLAADRFYGVTMSEPGISQLVSVKLNDDITETA